MKNPILTSDWIQERSHELVKKLSSGSIAPTASDMMLAVHRLACDCYLRGFSDGHDSAKKSEVDELTKVLTKNM